MGQELYSVQIAKKEEAARRAKQRAALIGRREPHSRDIQRSGDDQPRSLDSFRRGGIRARQNNVLPPRGRVDLRDAVPEWPIRHMVSIDESELVEIDEDDFVEVDEDDFEFVEVDEDDFIEIDEDEFWAGEATTEDSQSESESEGMIEEAQHFMVRRSPVVFTSRPDQGNDRPGLREPYTRR